MRIKALQTTYRGRLVLDMQGMELEKNKVYGIVGSNGSGKSTFAKILAGIIEADDGKCGLDNTGYMAQKSYAFNMKSIRKHIAAYNFFYFIFSALIKYL